MVERGATYRIVWQGEEREGLALEESEGRERIPFLLSGEPAETVNVRVEDVGEQIAILNKSKLEKQLRQQILALTATHYRIHHENASPFEPGQRVNYGGRFYDERELENLIDASLDFWLTSGRYTERFEKGLARYLGVKYGLLTNSGSSANLLAFMALTSPTLKERRIRKGDEVITVAASFPTTVNPIVQFGAVPVFVDITLETYNVDVSKLDTALSERTRAVMVAHTLGNPFDLQRVRDFCDRHRLWLIEDNCDALGSRYFYNGEWKYTGTVGHIATSSFYPPHHITMGEGGAVYTNDPLLKRAAESFRDWGRDCWCASGCDNTCRRRFSQQFGELPAGYDHKYVYTHFGYNLKVTDMQAAVGCAQLEKLPLIGEVRKRNWQRLYERLQDLGKWFYLPQATENSDPSWFGFLLTVRDNAPFTRDEIVRHLETRGIQTRMLFAGNLLRQPLFNEMRAAGEGYRVVGALTNTDLVMAKAFWLGVYPGLTLEMVDYMASEVRRFVGADRSA